MPFSFLLVSLTDAMRSLDDSRAYSVTLASHDHGLPRVTCHRFAYSYVSRYLLSSTSARLDSLRHGDVVMTSYHLCLSPVMSLISFVSPVLVTPNLLPGSSTLLSLTRLDVISISHFYGLYACLYLYRPYVYKYWVGDGTIPIFNLLCNHPSVVTCEIPRTLARPL